MLVALSARRRNRRGEDGARAGGDRIAVLPRAREGSKSETADLACRSRTWQPWSRSDDVAYERVRDGSHPSLRSVAGTELEREGERKVAMGRLVACGLALLVAQAAAESQWYVDSAHGSDGRSGNTLPVAGTAALAGSGTGELEGALRVIAHTLELGLPDDGSTDPPHRQQIAAAMLEEGVLERVLADPVVARAVRAAQAERTSPALNPTAPPAGVRTSSADSASHRDGGGAQTRARTPFVAAGRETQRDTERHTERHSDRETETERTKSAGPLHAPRALRTGTAHRLPVADSVRRRAQDSSAECPAPEPALLRGAAARRQQLNFTAQYSDSPTCSWVVECSKSQAVFARFSEFSSEYGTGPDAGYSDALSLYDGADGSTTLLNVLCGTAIPARFAAESGSMALEWQYQYSGSSPSFVVEYWCADASEIVHGCTDPSSAGFNPAANADDGSCYDHNTHALLSAFDLDADSRALNGWSTTADPCTCGPAGWQSHAVAVWEGVTCSSDKQIEILQIEQAHDVTFILGEELGQLTSLLSLSLWGSGLHGTLPRAVGSMSVLQTVDVDETDLSGTIPPISSQSLVHLFLYKTKLSGTVPRGVSDSRGLISLSLSNTKISGTLSEDIGRMSSLALLHLQKSAITGSLPLALDQMSALQCLSVSDTSINGYLPSTMEHMASLWSLAIDGSDISGTLVEALTTVPNFRSTVPSFECCSTCSCCQSRDPATPALPTLDLGAGTGISGTLIAAMSDMRALGVLGLGNTHLSGTIGTAIGSMTALQKLSAAGTRVSGTFGKQLTELTQLRQLQIYASRLSGTIPSAVHTLTALQTLDLPDTYISGTIPAALGTHLTVLGELSLYKCRLSGTLPPEIGQLGRLKSLYLDSNTLDGAVPDLSGCRSLKVLRLTNNSFDSLPAAAPGNITHFYLDQNPLNASAADLSRLTHGLLNLHTLAVGIVNVPIILESSMDYPNPRCNIPSAESREGCRGTWVKAPSSCIVGQPCSWRLDLRDADDQAARAGGLLRNLSIVYCGDVASTSCEHKAPMIDNRNGTFTATVPPGWIQTKGRHAFRFFHENNEFHPSTYPTILPIQRFYRPQMRFVLKFCTVLNADHASGFPEQARPQTTRRSHTMSCEQSTMVRSSATRTHTPFQTSLATSASANLASLRSSRTRRD